ncbi:MAG TPA: ADP-ribosylglycohydrolase family protein [Anaerolineaceae bacterium]|nr:ADP-ribosylglycohydrolase family protein [Anaerolineaceae bacterium]HPN52401.1 ADP-ribosylglycohydrolase family protein [Anaerolineaceae bacterium]
MKFDFQDRVCGCAVGAAVGDALGMPLEFGPKNAPANFTINMVPGRLPAGSFTDDTEMAVALAESLMHASPLDPDDLTQRFISWYKTNPPDIGIQTRRILSRILAGSTWLQASNDDFHDHPGAAGNGSIMRCWPVALSRWDNPEDLTADTIIQSKITHPHPDCIEACVFVNQIIASFLLGCSLQDAYQRSLPFLSIHTGFQALITQAPSRSRNDLENTGWVRHTLESAVWALFTFPTFEEGLVNVVNLGNDADTAGAVYGAMAGAFFGLQSIPAQWRQTLHGNWPIGSTTVWTENEFIQMAIKLALR